jgi:alpha-L-arabinofuranosidase
MSDERLRLRVGMPDGVAVSPTLWGLFLEDINYALDGGLNADLVRNGDFEFSESDHGGWHALTAWHADGAVSVRRDEPLSPQTAHYARLETAACLSNQGYSGNGLPVRAGTTYRCRLAVRASDGDARLSVVLGRDGEDLASSSRDVASAGWSWFEFDLRPEGDGPADLMLEAIGGTLDVDAVSLRPCDPATGEVMLFRPDLVTALRELKPAFVRFPGGCVAHGTGLDNLYHWKTTIGPAHQRRRTFNAWGYHQSRAIGYYEYFLLCELLGAEPLPVVAAGVCCQNSPGGPQAIPDEEMPAYVQDVVDLVEFANGGEDTTWGAVRAELGHPAPFRLRFLGVGNEDEITAEFEERFAALHDAVRRADPGVTVVGTVGPNPFGRDFDAGWEFARKLGVEMVDEHAYRSPRWFLQNANRYDDYDREGPAVYLGEYAARSSTLRSALAEAAYMIGLERNSDVVRLASYAPLLARVGNSQWTPDLLYFDDDVVMPTFSYHVQRLFAEHRGDVVCPVILDGAELRQQPLPAMDLVRLRSPGATVEFRDIRIDSAPVPDVRTVDDGCLVHVADRADTREVSLTARRVSGDEGFVVDFGAPGNGTLHELHIGGWRNKSLVLHRVDDGIGNEVDGPHPFDGVRTGTDVEVRVRIDGARIRCWVDGGLIHDHPDDQRPWPDIVAGATSTAAGAECIVMLVNVAESVRVVEVEIDGWDGDLRASLMTLTADHPDVGEAFAPAPANPVSSTAKGLDRLLITLPALSVVAARVARYAADAETQES